MSTRYKSSIINVRIFHNWIKTNMIQETVNHLKEDYNVSEITLLDLAVGKGGDMFKWLGSDIYNVVGIDIDEDSIKGKNGAIHRYKRLRNMMRNKNKRIPRYEFYVFDLSDPNNLGPIHKIMKGRKYNIISCQFAIHYFFRDASSLRTFMKIVSSYIQQHGFFIATTMNGDRLKTILKKEGSIGNNIFKIVGDMDSITDDPYGNKYTVSLGEKDEDHYFSKSDSVEFMVNIEELKRVCKEYGLSFVGTVPFEKWYQLYLKDDPKYKLSESEKEFSFLNFSFVFLKS